MRQGVARQSPRAALSGYVTRQRQITAAAAVFLKRYEDGSVQASVQKDLTDVDQF